MKVISRIDGSVCGAILSTPRPATRAAVSSRLKLRTNRPSRAPVSQYRRDHTRCPRRTVTQCPQTASWLLSTFLPAPSSRPRSSTYSNPPSRERIRWYSHVAAATAAADSHSDADLAMRKTREELLSFVDHQDVGTVDEHLMLVEDPYLNRYAQPEPTQLIISDKKEDERCTPLHEALRGDETTTQIIHKLTILTHIKLRDPLRGSLDSIYETYAALPEPRMIHLSEQLRHTVLEVIGKQAKKKSVSVLRYFSLLSDAKDCGIPITLEEWNRALYLAGRFVGRITEVETESALQLWKEMETDMGVKADGVTFNILFDAASKSGNFTLADMLYKEMLARGLSFNRYHHVSLIYLFGLRGDADGIRAAYKEMVEAGETVDIVVLNCVMSAFLKCGEDEAVLRVYEYMKSTSLGLVTAKPSKENAALQPQEQQTVAEVAVQPEEQQTAVDVTLQPEEQQIAVDVTLQPEEQQKVADVTPNLRTYRILINHFAVERGDLAQVAQFLEDMKQFNVPMHGSIFLALFEGFARYESVAFSEWTPARLENVLSALIRAIDDQVPDIYLDTWLMMRALQAFMGCSNANKLLAVYEEFKSRWDLEPAKAEYMDSYIVKLLDEKGSMLLRWQRPKVVRRRPL